MGWQFRLEDAPVVGWPTSRQSEHLYDAKVADEFLCGLQHAYGEHSGFIADPDWIDGLRRIGARYTRDGRDPLESRQHRLHAYMEEVRSQFRPIRLFALAVRLDQNEDGPLTAFIRHAAHASDRWGLFMIPATWRPNPDINLYGAFPVVDRLADVASWPGVVFWTPGGASTFAPLRDAEFLLHRLRQVAPFDPLGLDEMLREHDASSRRHPKLLHLSDLHFGTQRAASTQSLLQAYSADIVRRERVSRVVITGDLFDQPTPEAALAFSAFRQTLAMVTGSDPVVIPGNHDQKLFGNLAWSREQLADLEWSNFVVDDSLRMVFLCFDSAKDADLARGRVDEDQRRGVGVALQTRLATHPEIRQYLRVALIHHHPFSFHAPPAGLWKVFQRLGIREETFLRMDDAEAFVEWCAHRGAPLILHGHKHVPFHASAEVQVAAATVTVDSVGCGSSTGIGGPIGINLLSHDGNRWSVRFMVDPGDGRGLVEQAVVIRSVAQAA